MAFTLSPNCDVNCDIIICDCASHNIIWHKSDRIRKFMLLLLLFIKKCKIIFYCMVRCFTKNNLLSCHFSTLLTLFKRKYHNKYSPFHIVIWQTAILIPRWYVNYFLISIRMYLNMCKANFVYWYNSYFVGEVFKWCYKLNLRCL